MLPPAEESTWGIAATVCGGSAVVLSALFMMAFGAFFIWAPLLNHPNICVYLAPLQVIPLAFGSMAFLLTFLRSKSDGWVKTGYFLGMTGTAFPVASILASMIMIVYRYVPFFSRLVNDI